MSLVRYRRRIAVEGRSDVLLLLLLLEVRVGRVTGARNAAGWSHTRTPHKRVTSVGGRSCVWEPSVVINQEQDHQQEW